MMTVTESAQDSTSLPSPLDFSTSRRHPQSRSMEIGVREGDGRATYQSPVLDLRIRTRGDGKSAGSFERSSSPPSGSGPCTTNRSMFEAFLANAGTPTPVSPSRRSVGDRESDQVTIYRADDAEPPTQNPYLRPIHPGAVMPSAESAFEPRIGGCGVIRGPDTPLYVTTSGERDVRGPPSLAQLSPRPQIPLHLDSILPRSLFQEGSYDLVQFYQNIQSLPKKNHAASYSRLPLGTSLSSLYDQSNFYNSLPYSETLLHHSPLPEENSDMEMRRSPESSGFREAEYFRSYNSQETDGSGSDTCEQGKPLGSPTSSLTENHDSERKDDAYWERRRKNNEAAKRSRDARRAKEDEIAVKAAVLEKENICLKLNLAALKKEHQTLLLTLR